MSQHTVENIQYLGAKLYYKPDKKVMSINTKTSYKIRSLYNEKNYYEKLIYVLTNKFKVGDDGINEIKIAINDYLKNNFYKSDEEIFNGISKVLDRGYLIYIDISNAFDNYMKRLVLPFGHVCHFGISSIQNINENFVKYYKDHRIIVHNFTSNNIYNAAPYSIDDELLNNMNKYEENTYNLAILSMTLSYIPSNRLDVFLTLLAKIMTPEGLLIVQEYDLNPLVKQNTDLLDLVDWGAKNTTSTKNYNTFVYWTEQLAKYGFKPNDKLPDRLVEVSNNPLRNNIISYTLFKTYIPFDDEL